MRIIVLGGAGDVGSRAVQELAREPGVSAITIADRRQEEAERLARDLSTGAHPVQARAFDANDHEATVAVMRGHEVVASALGPFFRYEARMVAAALDAGVDYTSVCDEWDATESVFAMCSATARERGRIVLSGLGTSPGISNVGVRFLAEDLDRVRRAEISVFQPLTAGGGEAVIRHLLHIMTGDTLVWRAGEAKTVRALGECRVVAFPSFGRVKVWNMGHAEPATIPRFLPDIEEVSFFMGFGRGASLLVHAAKLGLFQSQRFVDWLVSRLLRLENRMGLAGRATRGAVRVDVWGERHGEPVHRLACGVGLMREATGVSLAVGALMLARKQVTVAGGGVYAPEACLDARIFMQAMKDKGIVAFRDLGMTRVAL
ncbi:MAG: saccharopine dehydrogenase NADP-binding domain-containing protein [Candidatus Schekmanbacteria bacterium]|nr:saccharopine dehydrogenase NADP-binding domain-containing protein [Candidatus Schekmanbacteria bacterium]